MDHGNGTIVFETLLKDHYFFQYVNDFIQNKILKTTKFDSKYIPTLLFIISNLLKNDNKYSIIMKNIRTKNEFDDLYYHINIYIQHKINEIININELTNTFDKNEFTDTYNTCMALLLLNFTFTINNRCCF